MMSTRMFSWCMAAVVAGSLATWIGLALGRAIPVAASQSSDVRLRLRPVPGASRHNVIFVLVDDLRFDMMGSAGIPGSRPRTSTPSPGVASGCRNAFVTTALCSPSRASILTGQYAHRHRVVDNNNADSGRARPSSRSTCRRRATKPRSSASGTWAGRATCPSPASTAGSASRARALTCRPATGSTSTARPSRSAGYITDELTDYAIDWLKHAAGERPFFLYLSHKAVHSEFVPAATAQGPLRRQAVHAAGDDGRHGENYAGKPMWVRNQRNSWHGVDFPYHSNLDIAAVLPALRRDAAGRRRQRRPDHDASARSRNCSTTRWSSSWATTALPSASTA